MFSSSPGCPKSRRVENTLTRRLFYTVPHNNVNGQTVPANGRPLRDQSNRREIVRVWPTTARKVRRSSSAAVASNHSSLHICFQTLSLHYRAVQVISQRIIKCNAHRVNLRICGRCILHSVILNHRIGLVLNAVEYRSENG